MSTHQFRQLVRENYPHIKVCVKTVSFADLARDSARCLTVEGDRSADELRQVNDWAKAAGIVPDGNIRCR